ncbi:unnamed protein product, partial [Closterium sp. Naga37s-1]
MSPHPPAPASSSQATVELGAAIERSLSRVHELERTVSLFNESNQLLLLDRMSVALALSLSPQRPGHGVRGATRRCGTVRGACAAGRAQVCGRGAQSERGDEGAAAGLCGAQRHHQGQGGRLQ